MNFIFLRFIKVWTQNVSCAKLTWRPLGVTYFARDLLRSYFDEPQENKIYFLNDLVLKEIELVNMQHNFEIILVHNVYQ